MRTPGNHLSLVMAGLLRPLVRLLLRNGMSFKAFSEVARRVFVEVGMRDMGLPGKKQTVSRVAILTGLSRKEVQRLQAARPLEDEGESHERYNRAARVIAGWVRDAEFTDAAGVPAVLKNAGADSGFARLVKRYSGDVPARAVLDELQNVGAIERGQDNDIRLLARAYVPRASERDKLHILGGDVADLITTIDHNLRQGVADPRFQRKVMYDNLPQGVIQEFRAMSAEQSQALLERLDKWLAQRDRDINPDASGGGRVRAGVGIYYFEEDLAAQEHSKDKSS